MPALSTPRDAAQRYYKYTKRQNTVHAPNTNVGCIPRIYEPWHEISNNVVCAASKASDQPAHTRSLIGAFASRLNIL